MERNTAANVLSVEEATLAVASFKKIDVLRNTIIFNRLNKGVMPALAGLDADAAVIEALTNPDVNEAVMGFRLAYDAQRAHHSSEMKEQRAKAAAIARKNNSLRTQAMGIKAAVSQGMDVNLEAFILSRPEIIPFLEEQGLYTRKTA
jgi:hypothetical protein